MYDSEIHPQSAGMYSSHHTDGHLSGRNRKIADPVDTPTAVYARSTAGLKRMSPTSNATHVVTYEPSTLPKFKADRVPHGRPPGLVVVRRNSFERYSNPSISIASSFLHSTIPPELRIPLSFLGKEKLQVQTSETVATDLDMRSYVLK